MAATPERVARSMADFAAFHTYASRCLGSSKQRQIAEVLGVPESVYSNIKHGRLILGTVRLMRWCQAIADHVGHYSYQITFEAPVRISPVRTKEALPFDDHRPTIQR